MPENESVSLTKILNDPGVQSIISDESLDELERRAYIPPRCKVFNRALTKLETDDRYSFNIDSETRKVLPNIIDNKVMGVKPADADSDHEYIKNYKTKRTIGIVFSGGPAPGGHNVISGIFDAAKKANPENKVLGFIMGPDGIIEGNAVELNHELVDRYRNLGGFSMIKTGRTKIDSSEKMDLSIKSCKKLGIDAIVVVGGDDSNTNAAFMAQDMFDEGIQVIGVPKTIDGDIQVRDASGEVLCAMSFGFHSAARAFSKNISDLCTDCNSDVKYWHFCKVMGRVASHLALEVALQTHANMTLIGEELADYVDEKRLKKAEANGETDYTAYGLTLRHLSRIICKMIIKRAAVGKNFGTLVIPEGILEFINEIQIFIIKLNTIISDYNSIHDIDFHHAFPRLDSKLEYLRRLVRGIRKDVSVHIWSARDDELFNDIPEFFQKGLLTERDSHGNFQFSQVETEKIIMQLVVDYLNILKEKGYYKVGIEKNFFEKKMEKAGLDPDVVGPVLFKNYNGATHFLVKESIISNKTLKNVFVSSGIIEEGESIHPEIKKVYEKSVPNLKIQSHFYGYDGRGSDPTRFDCKYTYNLGLTAFSLIANGASGHMAAIKNIEQHFSKWEPIGIPIAPLMHLEERGGKMKLVIEKSVVDLDSKSFKIVKALRSKWLGANPEEDHYRKPGPIRFTGLSEEERPITLMLNKDSVD